MNDPGTAIDIIGTGLRVLMTLVREQQQPENIRFPSVHVPPVAITSLFNGFFTPIARDGAAIVEVGIHLQRALTSLAAAGGSATLELARQHSQTAFLRAEKSLLIQADIDRLAPLVMR